jgi:hypothetical protein
MNLVFVNVFFILFYIFPILTPYLFVVCLSRGEVQGTNVLGATRTSSRHIHDVAVNDFQSEHTYESTFQESKSRPPSGHIHNKKQVKTYKPCPSSGNILRVAVNDLDTQAPLGHNYESTLPQESKYRPPSGHNDYNKSRPSSGNVLGVNLAIKDSESGYGSGCSEHDARKKASERPRVGSASVKFCHECGTRYPVTQAKFCCECGMRRLLV